MIHDQEALTRDVFPSYFKHSNFKSFARQLNFYGFRKIRSKDKECSIYHHEYFQIDRADLLPRIQRQTTESHHDTNSTNGTSKIPTVVPNSEEVNELKDKVNSLTATVSSLHMEIAELKSMVTSLAEGIRAQGELIRYQQPSQALSSHAETEHNTVDHESLKPQAKQTTSPILDCNHNMYSSQQNTHASFPYVDTLQQQDAQSRLKRRKISADEFAVYAPIATQHEFALPPPANMQPASLQPASMRPATIKIQAVQTEQYESRHGHWNSYPSDNYNGHHHHENNDQQVRQISYGTVDDPSLDATASLYNVECSADQDFGFEDLAWFAILEEELAHQTDDTKAAPQA